MTGLTVFAAHERLISIVFFFSFFRSNRSLRTPPHPAPPTHLAPRSLKDPHRDQRDTYRRRALGNLHDVRRALSRSAKGVGEGEKGDGFGAGDGGGCAAGRDGEGWRRDVWGGRHTELMKEWWVVDGDTSCREGGKAAGRVWVRNIMVDGMYVRM